MNFRSGLAPRKDTRRVRAPRPSVRSKQKKGESSEFRFKDPDTESVFNGLSYAWRSKLRASRSSFMAWTLQKILPPWATCFDLGRTRRRKNNAPCHLDCAMARISSRKFKSPRLSSGAKRRPVRHATVSANRPWWKTPNDSRPQATHLFQRSFAEDNPGLRHCSRWLRCLVMVGTKTAHATHNSMSRWADCNESRKIETATSITTVSRVSGLCRVVKSLAT